MKSIGIEQFLLDFWKSDDVVKVNAVELQDLIKVINELQLENKRLKKRIEILELLKAKSEESKAVPYVSLNIKV